MRLQDLFAIDLPIIQAPMAGVQDVELTLAVCNAGGLGSLPCAMLSSEDLYQSLKALSNKTNNPFNVNFFCHSAPVIDADRESIWRQTLQPYFEQYQINPNNIMEGAIRQSFNAEALATLKEFKPKVVSFHFGLPAADIIAELKSFGATILASATTVEEGLWLEANGADAVIAQGLEAGGHRSIFLTDDPCEKIPYQVGTFALIPRMVQALSIPVIAAGGITDSKAVAAVLSLGAIAAQIGTAYLLCDEAKTSSLHREALKKVSNETDQEQTVITNVFTGRPARAIVNRLITEVGPVTNNAPMFPLAASAVSALRKKAEQAGRNDFTPMWSGQNAQGCKEISASKLTRLLAADV